MPGPGAPRRGRGRRHAPSPEPRFLPLRAPARRRTGSRPSWHTGRPGRSHGPTASCADGVGRERVEREPVDGGRRCEVSRQHAQRMVAVEPVVAIRGDDEGRHVDPAREQAQHVEGRLVAPVEILEHQHGRLLGQLVVERREHGRRRCCDIERGGERIALRRHVEQRTKRARRRQCVAGTHEHTDVPVESAAESANERCLPGTRLAADENDSSRVRAGPRSEPPSASRAVRRARAVHQSRGACRTRVPSSNHCASR